MKHLENKVAIVTGAGQGIGKGIAMSLAEEGANIVVADITDKEKEVANNIAEAFEVETLTVHCDVTKKADVDAMVKQTLDKFNKIDILVNNAGIYPFKPFEDMTEQDWDKVMDVNLKGVFLVTKAVIPSMKKQHHGRIISISSIAGTEIGYANLVHYSTSKAGLMGFTRALALELAEHKITVNAVAPGAIETPTTKEVMSAEQYEQQKQAIPFKRWGNPEDIGSLVAFLAMDKAEYITGQNIVSDGGLTNL